MIEGVCFTSVDDCKRFEWPTSFVAVPLIGDRVMANCGNKVLKVCGITHYQRKDGVGPDIPGIRVELTKTRTTL